MNRLKELREEAMMTVRELSERSGVSEDTITKIENGHRNGRGMTLRKLAKALGVEPRVLASQPPESTTNEKSGTLETQLGKDTVTIESSESALRRIGEAYETIDRVLEYSGLGARGHYQFLSEDQELVLAVLAGQDKGLKLAEFAEIFERSAKATYRDLTILGEHGLVFEESGVSQATSAGKGLAKTLSKGGIYYDEALRYVATLLKAYESVAGIELSGLTTEEARSFFMVQERIVHCIERILTAAKPPPLAQELNKQRQAELANLKHQDEQSSSRESSARN